MIRDCNECQHMYPKESYKPHTQHVCGKTGYICYHDKDSGQGAKVIDVPIWCPFNSSSSFNKIESLKKQVEELKNKLEKHENQAKESYII